MYLSLWTKLKIFPDQHQEAGQEAGQDPVLALLDPVQVLQDHVQVPFDHGQGLVLPGPAPALLVPAQALQDHVRALFVLVRARGRNPDPGHGQDQRLDPGLDLGPDQGIF